MMTMYTKYCPDPDYEVNRSNVRAFDRYRNNLSYKQFSYYTERLEKRRQKNPDKFRAA